MKLKRSSSAIKNVKVRLSQNLVIILLIPQHPSPLAIGFPRLTATQAVERIATTWSGDPAPQQVQICPKVTHVTALNGQRYIDLMEQPVRAWLVFQVNLYEV